MRVIAFLMGLVLLLTGCADGQTDEVEAWASEQRSIYPTLTFERVVGMFGTDGARLEVSVASTAEAQQFSSDFAAAVAGKDRGRFEALITWPLEAGTVTLFESSRFPTPSEAWDWATRPLPTGATERRVGWYKRQFAGGVDDWPRVVEYDSTDIVKTLATAAIAPDAELSVLAPSGYAGPFPGAEVPARAGELATLGSDITNLSGSDITLNPESDLPWAARVLQGHPWRLRHGKSTVFTGQIDYDLLAELHGAGFDVHLSETRLGLGRLTPQGCTELFKRLRTTLTVGLSCGDESNRATLIGPLSSVIHDWGVLAPLVPRFELVEAGTEELKVRLTGLPQDDLTAVLAPLRNLSWPAERAVHLNVDGVSVKFDSTQTGTAKVHAPRLTPEQEALVEAWNASSS